MWRIDRFVHTTTRKTAAGALLAGLSLLSAGPLAASAGAAPTGPARPLPPTSGTHALPNALLPGLADPSLVTDLGPLPATQSFQVTLHLAEDQAAEAAAFAAITNPKSPQYAHFLTLAQYVAAFGEPAAVTAAVTSQATATGATAVYRNQPGTIVVLQGTAAQFEAVFSTPIHAFRTANGKVFRANTAAPTVPAAVDAVTGLETITDPTTNQACAAGANPVNACFGALTPQDLWSAYDQPATDAGAGQQIGIIGAGQADTVISDLRGFEADHGLRQVPVRVVNAADTYTYSAGEGEWALDSAATTGMAPEIDRLTYYFGDALGSVAPFAAFADDTAPGAPSQANYSVGGCESLNYALGSITTDEPLFRQMAMEGKTLFVSTGDTGGSCTVLTGNGFLNTGVPQVEWPSSSDAVVGVGGTELATDGAAAPKRVLEKAWDYTGGGSSDVVQEPSWQSAIATIVQPCATKAVSSPDGGAFCRGLPDVAALSGNITVIAGSAGQNATTMGIEQGYTDHEGATETKEGGPVTPGSPTVDGGTSLASPLWVGMWTRIQAAHGGGLGFAAPVLYSDAQSANDAADFYDISVGQNGQHQAQPRVAGVDPTGWDYVSGLGVPDVDQLAKHIAGTDVDPVKVTTANDGTQAVVDAASLTPAVACTNGVYTGQPNATGPTTVAANPQALDLLRTAYTEPTAGTLSVATTVQHLADSADSLLFTHSFSYLGSSYQLTAERDEPTGTTTYLLYAVGAPDPTTGTTSVTQLATLTGSFDDTTNTVTVSLPFATFNANAKPTTPLADGAQLAGLTTTSNTVADQVLFYDDTISTTCPYTVGGAAASTPPANLPEAPYAPLVLLGLLPVAHVVRRRRRALSRA